MKKLPLVISCFLGALGVGLGAFGAHGLKGQLTDDQMANFDTATRYLMLHVVVIIALNALQIVPEKVKNSISSIFLIGITCFSGSIYAIVFGVNASDIWFITPLGGLLFIVAWVTMGIQILRQKKF